jgi:hypothetical protein
VPTAFDSAVGGLAMVEVIIAGAVERLGEGAKRRIETLETLRRPFHLESVPQFGSRKTRAGGKTAPNGNAGANATDRSRRPSR